MSISSDPIGRSDAGHDAATSGGTPDETVDGAGSPGAGTVDAQDEPDLLDGVLSPGSSATDGPTEAAESSS